MTTKEQAAIRSHRSYLRKKARPEFVQNRRQAMRLWRAKNPGKAAANGRASYARHRDARNAQSRASYLEHREDRLAYNRRAYLANRERGLAYARAWRIANPQRSAEIRAKAWAKRRARLAGVAFEEIDRDFIILRDQGLCGICGKSIEHGKETLDHLIPVSLGGPHVATNLRIAHESCNKSRGPGRTPAQLRLV